MKNKIVLFFSVICISLIFSNCSLSTLTQSGKETATQQAFETVFAAMTTEAFLNPSATPTFTPTNTATLVPTATIIPTNTVIPTETATPQPAYSAKLTYVTTFPENKTEFLPNESFGIAFGFLNTGKAAWSPGSKLSLLRQDGEYVTVETFKVLEKTVASGEKIEFSLWAFGSEDMKPQTVYYQLYSESGIAISGGFATFTFKSY